MSLAKVFRPFALAILMLAGAPTGAFPQADEEATDPPGRVGRLSYMEGTVSFRSADEEQWVPATLNFPVTSGDAFWTEPNARAEIQIGSTDLRLDQTTAIEAVQLDDAATQIQVYQGSISLRVREMPRGGVRILTPRASVVVTQPGRYRVDIDAQGNEADDQVRLSVFEGAARIDGLAAPLTVTTGHSATIHANEIYPTLDQAIVLPLDAWAMERERLLTSQQSQQYVSPEMTGIQDLDKYGQWVTEPTFGAVWYPQAMPAEWAPYRDGHWANVRPWGWTWVDRQPWGFAPFHYGRWVRVHDRWGWNPGARVHRPVFAPALVAFAGGGSSFTAVEKSGHRTPAVGWVPLGPHEVFRPHYPHSQHHMRDVNVTNVHVNNIRVVNKDRDGGHGKQDQVGRGDDRDRNGRRDSNWDQIGRSDDHDRNGRRDNDRDRMGRGDDHDRNAHRDNDWDRMGRDDDHDRNGHRDSDRDRMSRGDDHDRNGHRDSDRDSFHGFRNRDGITVVSATSFTSGAAVDKARVKVHDDDFANMRRSESLDHLKPSRSPRAGLVMTSMATGTGNAGPNRMRDAHTNRDRSDSLLLIAQRDREPTVSPFNRSDLASPALRTSNMNTAAPPAFREVAPPGRTPNGIFTNQPPGRGSVGANHPNDPPGRVPNPNREVRDGRDGKWDDRPGARAEESRNGLRSVAPLQHPRQIAPAQLPGTAFGTVAPTRPTSLQTAPPFRSNRHDADRPQSRPDANRRPDQLRTMNSARQGSFAPSGEPAAGFQNSSRRAHGAPLPIVPPFRVVPPPSRHEEREVRREPMRHEGPATHGPQPQQAARPAPQQQSQRQMSSQEQRPTSLQNAERRPSQKVGTPSRTQQATGSGRSTSKGHGRARSLKQRAPLIRRTRKEGTA